MTALEMAVPAAVHIAVDEIPFVDTGDGFEFRVLQVHEREALWIMETNFHAGYEAPRHRHTGPVWGYTTSGAWHYKEHDFVNRAGSFLYEPANSVHTLECLEEGTRVWFQAYGMNLNLDEEDRVVSVGDGRTLLHWYWGLCEQAGLGRPPVMVA